MHSDPGGLPQSELIRSPQSVPGTAAEMAHQCDDGLRAERKQLGRLVYSVYSSRSFVHRLVHRLCGCWVVSVDRPRDQMLYHSQGGLHIDLTSTEANAEVGNDETQRNGLLVRA